MPYAASKSCENMLDLLPIPGLVPVSLKVLTPVARGGPAGKVKATLEDVRFVQSTTLDVDTRVVTVVVDAGALGGKTYQQAIADLIAALKGAGFDSVEHAYEKKPTAYDKSEWLIFAAVGVATAATAYAFLEARVPL